MDGSLPFSLTGSQMVITRLPFRTIYTVSCTMTQQQSKVPNVLYTRVGELQHGVFEANNEDSSWTDIITKKGRYKGLKWTGN